jgi:hypothetical protein
VGHECGKSSTLGAIEVVALSVHTFLMNLPACYMPEFFLFVPFRNWHTLDIFSIGISVSILLVSD